MNDEVKENKGKKEISPHTPYIEKRETKETSSSSSSSRAGAREENQPVIVMPPVINPKEQPSLEVVLFWAKGRGYTDEAWSRKWYDKQINENFWCDKETGDPIKHWPSLFIKNYLYDHEPGDHRSNRGRKPSWHIQVRHHADNWRGTDPRDIKGVL